MAIQADIGGDPVYFSGDTLQIKVTIRDGDASPIVSPLPALDLSLATQITWVLAKKQGGTPIITKTLTSPGGVSIVSSPATDGRVNIQLDNADTAGLKGSYYHELQIEPGPSTALFGNFEIQPDSAPP
jgi:hypothetical protein